MLTRCSPIVETGSSLKCAPQSDPAPWAGRIFTSSDSFDSFFVQVSNIIEASVDADPGASEFPALAEALRRSGRLREAEDVARRGLGRKPGSLEGSVALALALLDQGRVEALHLEEVAEEAGIDFFMNFIAGEQGEAFKFNLYDHGSGVNVADYDGDGFDDLYFMNQLGPNALYRNNGDGTFTYDPNGQFESLAVGETATDSFTYTISDGNGGTDTATVTITITGLDESYVIYLSLLLNRH